MTTHVALQTLASIPPSLAMQTLTQQCVLHVHCCVTLLLWVETGNPVKVSGYIVGYQVT